MHVRIHVVPVVLVSRLGNWQWDKRITMAEGCAGQGQQVRQKWPVIIYGKALQLLCLPTHEKALLTPAFLGYKKSLLRCKQAEQLQCFPTDYNGVVLLHWLPMHCTGLRWRGVAKGYRYFCYSLITLAIIPKHFSTGDKHAFWEQKFLPFISEPLSYTWSLICHRFLRHYNPSLQLG